METPVKNQKAKTLNIIEQAKMQPKLKKLIQSNFNILLYGVGSKINFLNYFCLKTFSTRKNVLLFNGFNPSCNMRIVMQALK